MNIEQAELNKEKWEVRNAERALARAEIGSSSWRSRFEIASVLRVNGVKARGLANRIFRRRKLTPTQAYALPAVY